MIRLLLSLILFVNFSLDVLAQEKAQDKLISIKSRSILFTEFVEKLKNQTGYKIYYDWDEVKDLKLNVSFDKQSLTYILDHTLANLQLFYTQDELGEKIYITSLAPISMSVSENAQLNQKYDLISLVQDFSDTLSLATTEDKRVHQLGSPLADTTKTRIISGYIRSLETLTPLASIVVKIEGSSVFAETNSFGFYSLIIPQTEVTLNINGQGKQEISRKLRVYESGNLDFELNNQVYALGEVQVSGQSGTQIRRTQMGLEKVNIQTIKQAPSLLGEADVVRVLLTLPGVQSAGEGAGGFNVRGGSTDQNLVLLNDATIFNPSHFFGFFSAFNSDFIQEVELYKSGIPSQYGGRISSILDVKPKIGNSKKFSGSGGIGLLTSRLTLEGPINKKSTLILSGRSTYSDWLMDLIPDEKYNKSSAFFYDVNALLSFQLSDKDALYVTAYNSSDRFSFNTDTAYSYQNLNLNIKWNRSLYNNGQREFTIGYDQYEYEVEGAGNPFHAFNMEYKLSQYYGMWHQVYKKGLKNTYKFGAKANFIQIQPGNLNPTSLESLVNGKILENEQALETSLYFSNNYLVNDQLSVDWGIRYTLYNYLGAKTVRYYENDDNKSSHTQVGEKSFDDLEVIKTYHLPEIRVGARYAFSDRQSVKASFNTLSQNIHMLSNTTSITPTDSWKLSDLYIKPQQGYQGSIGYYLNFLRNSIESSVEVYYKGLSNYLDYKSGATLIMNEHLETDVLSTDARAYGIEFSLKKGSGKFNGWLSYAYSRVEQKNEKGAVYDLINNGEYFASNYDKPHSLNLVLNYKLTHRLNFSLNSEYSTGRPITMPIGQYVSNGSVRVYYSDRNQYRIPDYFRTDVSINIEGNHKVNKLAHSSWSLGVYNALGRKNPYSIYFKSEENQLKGYQLSIFGHQIPFITYNFKF